jgi:cell division protein ZapA (FtsZ GTPase activity inhibitor)
MAKPKKEQEEKLEEVKAVVISESKEISNYQQESSSVESMIMTAIKEKVDPAIMKEFLAMRKELKAEWAKDQFNQAMANFQAELPEIKKLKEAKNDQGKILYKYAPLESIIGQVKGILAKNGLSYSVKTEVSVDKVKSICIIKHRAGHSEESEMETPLATKTGIMSQPQQIAATATFTKRYAFMNALGIMTGDEDNEKALMPASQNDIEKAIEKLDHCMTMQALKEVWSSFSKELKADKEVIRHANEIKALIVEAQKNENSSN